MTWVKYTGMRDWRCLSKEWVARYNDAGQKTNWWHYHWLCSPSDVTLECCLLFQSIERETKLRRQLQEASQRLEEQNVRVNIAEDKLKVSSEMSDKYQKEVKTTRQEVQSLKVCLIK